MLKIFKVRPEKNNQIVEKGKIETDGKSWLRYAASDGYVYIEDLQLEGKKRMAITDFLRGYRP